MADCRRPRACWRPTVCAGSWASPPARARGGPRLGPLPPAPPRRFPAGVKPLRVAANNPHLPPSAIIAALAARGFHRILIEGGADTVSRFLAARCLDRLHILVAPIILGAGRSSLTLPPIERVDEAVRAPMRVHSL